MSMMARLPTSGDGRMVPVGDVQLHVREAGPTDGPPVLLIHGASANAREWDGTVVPAFADKARLIMVDRPGHGFSKRPRKAERLGVQAGLMAGLLHQLGIARASVVAHSYGAAVALRLALDFPDRVARLTLLAPASHPYPGGNAWHAHLAAWPVLGPLFVRTVVPMVGPKRMPGAITNSFAPGPVPERYAEITQAALSLRPASFRANARDIIATQEEFGLQAPRYGEITAPTTVITADKDRVVWPKIHALALVAEIPGARLITTAGAGHMPHWQQPDVVVASALGSPLLREVA
jgi:pimeloyl-ACP methyl ester carboxylesterase